MSSKRPIEQGVSFVCTLIIMPSSTVHLTQDLRLNQPEQTRFGYQNLREWSDAQVVFVKVDTSVKEK